MVVPSFTGFAATPNTATAFLGGAALAQKAVDERNQVEHANQALQLQAQRLQQEQVQANMELQAKQQAHQEDSMRKDQEMLIQDQYHKQMIGLKQQQLDEAAKMVSFKTQEVARKFQAQQMFKTEAQQAIEGGATPEEAYHKAAMKFGPEMGITGPGLASLMKEQGGASDLGTSFEIPGLNPQEFKGVHTSAGGVHVVKMPPNMEATGPAPAGYVRMGNRVLPEREPIAVRQTRKDISDLEKVQEKDIIGKFAEAKAAKGENLSPDRKRAMDRYTARQAEIDRLRKSMTGPAKASSNFKEGQVLTHKKTGDKYRVTNGVPVLINSAAPDENADTGEDTMGE